MAIIECHVYHRVSWLSLSLLAIIIIIVPKAIKGLDDRTPILVGLPTMGLVEVHLR